MLRLHRRACWKSAEDMFCPRALTPGLTRSLGGFLGAVGAEQLPGPHPLGAKSPPVMTEGTSPGATHGSWGQDVPGESLALEPLLGAQLRVASPSERLVAVGPRACAVQPSIVSWSRTSEDESWERALGLVPQEPSGVRPGASGWAALRLLGDHVQSRTWRRESPELLRSPAGGAGRLRRVDGRGTGAQPRGSQCTLWPSPRLSRARSPPGPQLPRRCGLGGPRLLAVTRVSEAQVLQISGGEGTRATWVAALAQKQQVEFILFG